MEKNAKNSITVFRRLIPKHDFLCGFTMLIASFPGACQFVHWHMPVNQILMLKNRKECYLILVYTNDFNSHLTKCFMFVK